MEVDEHYYVKEFYELTYSNPSFDRIIWVNYSVNLFYLVEQLHLGWVARCLPGPSGTRLRGLLPAGGDRTLGPLVLDLR